MVSRPKKTVMLGSFIFPVFLMLPALEESLFFRAPGDGIASWYGREDALINAQTASGEAFDDTQATCASWRYPFGTSLKITNIQNGKSVICRVNDRGPAPRLGRAVDLTRSGFEQIADPEEGLARVMITPLALDGASGRSIDTSA